MALYKRGGRLWFREEQGRCRNSESFYSGVASEIEVNQVLNVCHSGFQEIMVLNTPRFGKVLVIDGIFQTSEKDEYMYHVPMVAFSVGIHPKPKSILIVGGGDGGVASKVARFPHKYVSRIDLVEIDKQVAELSQKYFNEVFGHVWFDPRLDIHFENGLYFVKKTRRKYDVVMVDSSEDIGPNKPLFDEEFYYHVRNCLKPGGVMVCQAGSLFYNWEQVLNIYRLLQTKFNYLRLHRISVPLYMGDFALISARKNWPLPNRGELCRLFSRDPARESKWVNTARYGASLVLPVEVEVELNKLGASNSQLSF